MRGVQFVDVAASAGVDFVHDNGASAEKRLPETMGSGVAFVDTDGDGDLDLYFVNSGHMVDGRRGSLNRLYANADGIFTDVTENAGVGGEGFGMGVAAADFDNDGDRDLYLTSWGADILYRNDASGGFSRAESAAGLGNDKWSTSAAFFDYDRDGDVDLYVTNYVEFALGEQPWCGRTDLDLRFYCDPRQFEATVDELYRNNGDGTFTEVGRAVGIDRPGNGLGVLCADYDGDGDSDIYVANDLTPNFLYENSGQGSFSEEGLFMGVAMSAEGAVQSGMGVDAGDFDNDGDLDLFVTNYQLQNNDLYRNDGDVFVELSAAAGVGRASLDYLGFGGGFFDYDNDGRLDVFVANGHVHDNIREYDELVRYAQLAQVFQGDGLGGFVERTAELGQGLAVPYTGRGSAFGDFDSDGDVDIALSTSGRRAVLLRHDGDNIGNWLEIRLEGKLSNRDGIGARVYVTADDLQLLREAGTSSGYLSASQPAPFFGLGTAERASEVVIRWPSGVVQRLHDVAANQRLIVVEEER